MRTGVVRMNQITDRYSPYAASVQGKLVQRTSDMDTRLSIKRLGRIAIV